MFFNVQIKLVECSVKPDIFCVSQKKYQKRCSIYLKYICYYYYFIVKSLIYYYMECFKRDIHIKTVNIDLFRLDVKHVLL
jgi:hypothetical protein